MGFSSAYLELFDMVEDLLEKEASVHHLPVFGMSKQEEKQLRKLVKKHAPKASLDEVMHARSGVSKLREAIFGYRPEHSLNRYLGKKNRSLSKENKLLKRISGESPSIFDDPVTNLAFGAVAGGGAALAYNSRKNKHKTQ